MTDPVDRLASALANRYEIGREIGAGGMAAVYLAEDLKHHRKVAVKVLRPELAAVLGADRFVQEIETTAHLQHPNILPLFDSGEADGFLYYVMPFIDGETLRDKLNREKQLSIEEAVQIAKDVAEALEAAHGEDVIHRDIKPENVLLHKGRAMVADFGIALAVSAAAGGRMTETGLSLGTPHYMSPEQATAQKDLTNRSDIYSLGAVLYEMLAGDPPHTGGTAQQIIAKIVTNDVQPVTKARKRVPPNVAAAVAKSLEKLAADRFESAAKFAEALNNPAFTLPTLQPAALASRPAGGPWNRLSVAAVAIASMLAGLLLWVVWRPEPPKPVIRYTLALPEEQALQPVPGTSVTLSPDGSLLVYVGRGDQGTQLWLRERDQLVARPLPGTEAAWQPFFAPDGERVGFVTEDRKLKVVSLTGEPPLTLVDSPRLQRAGAAWGDDGYAYFTLAPQPWRLHRMPTTGDGDPEPIPLLDNTFDPVFPLVSPDVLPSGKGVLFTDWSGSDFGSEADSVVVVDLATGEHRVLVQGSLGRYAAGHLVYLRYDGALLAAPFDQDKLVLSGPSVLLLAGAQPGRDLALSETGRLVYVAASMVDSSEVVWVDRDGTAEPIDPSLRGNFVELALSPDETRLAVNIGLRNVTEQLWVKQLPRGPLSLLTVQGDLNRQPAWTLDGESVMFASDRGENHDLYARQADGSAAAELLMDDPRPVHQGFYSPDGEWLVYGLEQTRDDHDILAIRPGIDSVATPLVATGFNETHPALSPDGRWLAYASNESGRFEVYVRPFPNVGDAKRQVSTNGGLAPVWAHSGRELFYTAPDDHGSAASRSGSMISAAVLPGTTFRLGEQRVLFAVGAYQHAFFRPYDVTSDDQRFVMIRLGESSDAGELIVVENTSKS